MNNILHDCQVDYVAIYVIFSSQSTVKFLKHKAKMMNLTPYFNSKLGAEIRVTGHSHRGQTKRQEDAMDVAFQSPSEPHNGNSLYAFFGVFDGHGGPEAALYVKKHLMSHIINQPNFWSDNDSRILRAIKDGYLSVQEALWLDRQTKMSLSSSAADSAASSSSARHLPYPSFPGTTATIAFLKEGKLYVGHIGNSGIVIGYQEPGYHFWRAKKVTEEHTPDKLPERERMRRSGLAVKSAHGIPRVVSRSTYFQQGTTRNDKDEIAVDNNSPFLPLARSLGDLWSYSREKHHFLVSPVPDTFVVEVDSSFRCLIFATDGLWTVVTEQDAVDTVFHAERAKQFYQGDQAWTWTNPSKKLVKQALSEWRTRRLRADNTSVVTVVFDRLTSKPNRLSEVENQLHRVSSKDEIMIQYYKAVIIVSILLMTFFAYIKYIDA